MILLEERNAITQYEQLALLIAKKIAKGQFKEHEKLNPIPKIGDEYSVSRETARKGLKLLESHGVLDFKHGSGVTVASSANAERFINLYQNIVAFTEIQHKISDSIEEQKSYLGELSSLYSHLIDETNE
ncbi:hypothetical protein HMPREF9318_01719 [Streptococcus urinalis FB127-CNA-2]|uniref:winged helix-turn-helix domain-containing protein n=1 Tax=Streptococcus urinalis TaxID=149016 RepID=UPI00029935E9|nr:winged helix-turn-helix domain-containing protein [Streptococcus urinalis]EKS18220.1 hypothetical protein HMPREF9318_01719 [Streptococcus urinalis FB127-CNA-2]VEF32905.1 GntR family transcriptional regulator [Streptococcus urinalis]